MCLPNFERFEQVDETNALLGYRTWRLPIKNPNYLLGEYMKYVWDKPIEGPHKVKDKDSGLYAYNSYNNYNNNNNYNYNYNNYNNNNNYNYNYNYNYCNNYNNYNYNCNNCNNIVGEILQYGKVAIHKSGQRSEYAKIQTLYTIRELDAQGPEEFLGWIKKFNQIITNLAKKYECTTKHWQDLDLP